MIINFFNQMKKIYLDHAATTPLDERVLEAMKPYFSDKFGNASSIHSFGQEARAAVDQSREVVAQFLNCQPSEVIFTSGGSESDNLAIKGVVEAIISQNHKSHPSRPMAKPRSEITNRKQIQNSKSEKLQPTTYKLIPHVVTSAFEHHAVLDTVKELEREGLIEASYIEPDKKGIIHVEDIEKAIKSNTVLVSIMYVNNEIGTVQPIREIGKLIEKVNLGRFDKPNKANSANEANYLDRIYFHTDAVQAAEYFNMDTKYLHCDLLTLSAHKIYGPKGVGVLFIKKDTPIKHQIIGGGQEYKMRAGTENVAGIAGFAKAVELIIKEQKKSSLARHPEPRRGAFGPSEGSQELDSSALPQNDRLLKLRDKLIKGIEEKISDVRVNGSTICRSPNNVNVTFHNAEGESILLNLDAEGIAASSGSACTSGSLEPSHVLMALGQKAEEAHGSIRFTLGHSTTSQDIDRVLEVLLGIIEKLREMSPYK